jgi:hypothetical protein
MLRARQRRKGQLPSYRTFKRNLRFQYSCQPPLTVPGWMLSNNYHELEARLLSRTAILLRTDLPFARELLALIWQQASEHKQIFRPEPPVSAVRQVEQRSWRQSRANRPGKLRVGSGRNNCRRRDRSACRAPPAIPCRRETVQTRIPGVSRHSCRRQALRPRIANLVAT